MSKEWTSEQVRRVARDFPSTSLAFRALDSFAAKLEREEEENKRDPVTDPWPGDMMRVSDGLTVVWVGHVEKTGHTPCANFNLWLEASMIEHATIIRRREVPQ